MKLIAAAIVEVQKEIKPAIKDSENPAFKSGGKVTKYADLGAVWDACRESLTKNGLCVVQTTDFEGDTTWLRTLLLHTSGESIEGRFPLRTTQAGMQGVGSALTYARRYGLSAMLGIVADVDDDGNLASGRVANGNVPPEGIAPPPAGDRKAGAKKWGEDALITVNAFKNAAEFSAWHRKHATAIATVRDFNEALHKRLTDAIAKKNSEFYSQPLAAAE